MGFLINYTRPIIHTEKMKTDSYQSVYTKINFRQIKNLNVKKYVFRTWVAENLLNKIENYRPQRKN